MPLAFPLAAQLRLAGTALAALLSAAGSAGAQTAIGAPTTGLIDRLCDQTLRTNEEDRLYGMISNAVRATIRYRGATMTPDLIDDAVQDSLDALIDECPEFSDIDQGKRLSTAIEIISDATTKSLAEHQKADKEMDPKLRRQDVDKVTAADLSQELSSQEIDQWLDSLPPRERALSLFLYASDVTPAEIAAAVGEPTGALNHQFAASKTDLMHIFREEWDPPTRAGATRGGPAIQYSLAGASIAALLPGPAAGSKPGDPPAPMPAAAPVPAPPSARPTDGTLSALRVTGISSDLYAGWSLLATAANLPPGTQLDVGEPFLLIPDDPQLKRMLVTGVAEIGRPGDPTRRFLLKAYAIDAEKDAAGLTDTFHLGTAAIDNAEAKKTLANPNLSSIEVARCLWFDFGTGPDPGLCR